ncbi:MAG: protein kinase, partial [Acidobacteria bacterium]|nr:protein kinase [Acidobacteriota bacterium]
MRDTVTAASKPSWSARSTHGRFISLGTATGSPCRREPQGPISPVNRTPVHRRDYRSGAGGTIRLLGRCRAIVSSPVVNCVAYGCCMTTLGHYSILEKLGSGGMGEVFRAHDTRLGRDVALKTLLPELAADEERRARFEREARAVAALNHPNIVTLYSIESSGSVHFLTMELVSGTTLSAAIPPGGLPVERFFDLALPLADA